MPRGRSPGTRVIVVTDKSGTQPETLGSLPPEPVEERESVSTVTPGEYPDPANARDIGGPDRRHSEKRKELNDGSLSSSEMQDAGMGEDEGQADETWSDR